MKRALALTMVLSAVGLAGCPQDIQPVGFNMRDFFQFENGRTWVYSTLTEDVDYVIDATLDPAIQVEVADGEMATVIHYEKRCIDGVEECGAGFLYDLYMSEDAVLGVMVNGYETPDKGKVIFDKPLRLTEGKMSRGDDVVSTEVDGHTFTSTFFDMEKDGTIDVDGEPIDEILGCDQDVGVEWECVHLKLESDPPGHWLAGDWWASAGWNLVAWKRTDDVDKWRTIDARVYEGGGDTGATDDTDQ